MRQGSIDPRGIAAAAGAYALWGLLPGFWGLLAPAGALEVLGHRLLWTFLLMSVVTTVMRGWGEIKALGRRGWLLVTAASLLIGVNWGTFIYGVEIDRVLDVALGYYINPLFSVLLGVLVLGERLRPVQWVAMGIAAVAVVIIGVGGGTVPWLALVLAGTFGLYGLIKKSVPLGATGGVTAEGIVLGPFALAGLLWLQLAGQSSFLANGPLHTVLLVLAGPVTAIPLLLFAAGARRIPLTAVGLLQYIAPTLQFFWGLFVLGEPLPASRWVGFVLVWIALAIFTGSLLRSSGRGGARGTDLSATAAEAH